MNNYWIPVIAALGASALTGLVTLGLDERRARRQRCEGLTDRRVHAYSRMISHAASFTLAAGAMHFTAQVRSGLTEALDIVLHHRKPVEPLDLHDWLMRELGPMLDAMAEIWVVGTPQAVVAANELMKKCNKVLELGTNRGESGSPLMRYLIGEKWTSAQMDSFQEAIDGMSEARKKLAEVARIEMGVGFTALFTNEERATDSVSGAQPIVSKYPASPLLADSLERQLPAKWRIRHAASLCDYLDPEKGHEADQPS